ncbi:1-acyl-sn-glycerol-3-phosphate acyltransferase [Dyadobacter subterraneus]|uniref:1-acyl-sn-glycerol-3-phosphate acyltransferase n=1 Tax=Dyadobacter subterraneus TaxID=2773304 RepID=A0ABR9WF77_9BACT|nr:trifunctional MMPL family transporter/lysophospholipid acyltransferase/class I SAM-dependent methyltransferase [Dyadobacter subterraneus]MBE9464087.1 1-acyl-sn-glycerol-3-phosphate acyltransferase [Dyadobacter subterraneus]
MIGDLLLRLNTLLSRNKTAFFLSLLAIIAVLGFGISRLKITESIFSTLPKGKTFEEFNRLVENKSIINQIVFSINIKEETDTEDAKTLAENFASDLEKNTKEYIKNIQAVRPNIQQDVYDYTFARFPELIDSSYYQHIANKTKVDSIKISVSNSYKQLLAPGGTFLRQFILNDPLGVSGKYFRDLNAINNSNGMTVDDGLMFSKDRKQIIVMAGTNYDSGNSAKNIELYNRVETFKASWGKQHPDNQFSYFGTFEIAAQNAIQVKHDSYTTMIIALSAILLIMILYYRKILIPFYIVLPAIFGGVFALGIIGFFRPEISGISLATGAVLFGILLDYSFHFFTHLRHTGSVKIAVKEVSVPLLTGSLTTILAFSALHFANSVVLQDFGLFASLSLSGAAFFTLIGLPVILQAFNFDYKNIPGEIKFFNFPKIPAKFRSGILFLVAILTVVFLYYSQFTEFDSSFENLSIHSADLKEKEQLLTGINPENEKRIYVFSMDKNKEKAEELNYQVFQKLTALKANKKINGFVSSGSFLIPEKLKKERQTRWTNFWNGEKKAKTFSAIDQSASQNGFNGAAFDNFKTWVSRENENPVDEKELFSELGLNNLIESNPGKTTLITTIVANQNQLSTVKTELRRIQGVEIFDRGELAAELLTMVKDDFNYILIISASIVFLTLLIVYGRFELTILSFMPMVISWIWILGIAALLGIKFNFVNVVITTFIFGLGDDFSIFVTEGLLSKYKYGKDTLRSYQSAIVLSAFTTIVGTGVLIFAQHPAIHSIALISVLGIVCILFVSFIVQPVVFNFFVENRIKRKKAPVTMLPFILSITSFTYFLSGCLFLHSKLVLIILLPISKLRKKRMINNSLAFFAKTVIYSGPHVKKNFSGTEHMDISKPVIYIANHTSFLDILLAIMINPKIVMMVKGWVYNSPFFGPIIRFAGYIYTEAGPEENIARMRKLIEEGYSILVFPEGTRSEDGKIGRFHKGAFHLAQELNLDIQPILIHGASDVLPKGDFLIRPGALNVRVLPRLTYSDPKWGESLRDKTKNISAHFKSEFELYKDEMEDTSYLKHKIFTNYVFKGPVLEWYFKTKWNLEAKNYTYYNELIGDRKNILDVGCGYGYLSFYLHYKNEHRLITGVDYDEDKILIARNSYNKTENLQFRFENIMATDMAKQDIIFLNDILHYLSEENQQIILNRCATALNPGGILFIRDGITDLKEKHKNTERTEALSTGLFSFNKKDSEFHFFSSSDIRIFAEKNYLNFEMQEHSKNTSNVLIILRKQPQTSETE